MRPMDPVTVHALATLQWLARWGDPAAREPTSSALLALGAVLGVVLPVCRPKNAEPSAVEFVRAYAHLHTAVDLLPSVPDSHLAAGRVIRAWVVDELRAQILTRAGWRRAEDVPDRWIDPQDIARECGEADAWKRLTRDVLGADAPRERSRLAG